MCTQKLKPVFRSFLATLVFGTALSITACSNEEEITNNNEMLVMQRPSNFIDADLEQKVISFYGNITFTTGRTASTNVNGVYYDCTELIINSDTRARGYIFFEQMTGNFLYITDVDRENYLLRIYDFITGENKIFSDINNLSDYSLTEGFDFIRIIEEPVFSQPVDNNPITLGTRYSYGNGNLVQATVPCGEEYAG